VFVSNNANYPGSVENRFFAKLMPKNTSKRCFNAKNGFYALFYTFLGVHFFYLRQMSKIFLKNLIFLGWSSQKKKFRIRKSDFGITQNK